MAQPHRYTRLSSLFAEFCTCFNEADTVIVADVYPAGEAPIAGANRDALVEGLRAGGHRDARALEGEEALPALIASIARPGDMVVCLGAGSITKWANALPGALRGAGPGECGLSGGGGSRQTLSRRERVPAERAGEGLPGRRDAPLPEASQPLIRLLRSHLLPLGEG